MDQHTCKSFIKTSVNIMKQKLMKVSGIRSVAQKSKCALWRTLHLSKPRFTYFIHFFFLSTVDFKFNIVLIGFFWIIFITIYWPFCFLIHVWYFTDLEVYPLLLLFFIKITKILIKLSVFFLKSFRLKIFLLCPYFSRKTFTC